MTHPNHQLIREFFAALPGGEVPEHLLAPDMAAWSTLGGDSDKAHYLAMVKTLGMICSPPIRFTIKSLTAEDDRVAAEVESQATLINGEEYRNTYAFFFRIRDGRIASVAEHFNAITVRETFLPAMQLLAPNRP